MKITYKLGELIKPIKEGNILTPQGFKTDGARAANVMIRMTLV